MNEEQYKKHKPFAGEKKPSMKRRCVGHDYNGRSLYMITVVVEGRKPLLGKLVGDENAEYGSLDAPRIQLSELGKAVSDCWYKIEHIHREISIVALQVMPDHLHGILFVHRDMALHLGNVIAGFKSGCNRAYKILNLIPVECAATMLQNTEPHTKQDRTHGLLFEPGYNDRLLYHNGQLQHWIDYLHDNPRRLLVKRLHPDYFRVQQHLSYLDMQFSAIGNRFLLCAPYKLQIQCSRRLSDAEVAAQVEETLKACSHGAVLVSPCISPGEKAVMRAAFQHGYPVVVLRENGFTALTKPGGKSFDACASGKLLLIAPWRHHNEKLLINRTQCCELNEMARRICENDKSLQ